MSVIALLSTVLSLAPPYQIDSVRVRFTHYEQRGIGYQSAAGPVGQPGSEELRVEQPQVEVLARLGERVTQRIWVPLDVVTAASPDHSRIGMPIGSDPPDAVSSASRSNVAGSLDALTTYRWDRTTEISVRAAFHIEEPFESWAWGLGVARSFAEENTVVSASLNQSLDWFDNFDIEGQRHARRNRATTNLNLGLTQALSPTTVAVASYGSTVQIGTLNNTWSSVLMADGTRGEERLPHERLRHALAVRLAQWLPWEGALKLGYRAYADDWRAFAHTGDVQVVQRLRGGWQVRGDYRVHWQSAVRFFTTAASPVDLGFRTADSDLARFVAQTVGGAVSWTRGLTGHVRDVHVSLGYERYFRSNDLTVDIATCGFGLLF